jgi:hypothetical protein
MDRRDSSNSVRDMFLRYARSGEAFPRVGFGRTANRFAQLRRAASQDSSLGRLVEAHEDAIEILAEAGMDRPRERALAVWASSASASKVVLQRSVSEDEHFELSGKMAFCGGAAFVDAALVLAESPQRENSDCRGNQLVLVRLNQPGVTVQDNSWTSPVFCDAGIRSVSFDGSRICPDQLVGKTDFYSTRPGFWHGSVGVAAGWVGMVDALLAMRETVSEPDQVALVRSGRVRALAWSMTAAVEYAAQCIDTNPSSLGAVDALAARHTIATNAEEIVRLILDEAGPRKIAFDDTLNVQVQAIQLAVRQCHGDRDLLLLAQQHSQIGRE